MQGYCLHIAAVTNASRDEKSLRRTRTRIGRDTNKQKIGSSLYIAYIAYGWATDKWVKERRLRTRWTTFCVLRVGDTKELCISGRTWRSRKLVASRDLAHGRGREQVSKPTNKRKRIKWWNRVFPVVREDLGNKTHLATFHLANKMHLTALHARKTKKMSTTWGVSANGRPSQYDCPKILLLPCADLARFQINVGEIWNDSNIPWLNKRHSGNLKGSKKPRIILVI